jgi:predicted alpha/beta-fold hydrolase
VSARETAQYADEALFNPFKCELCWQDIGRCLWNYLYQETVLLVSLAACANDQMDSSGNALALVRPTPGAWQY